LSLFHYKRPLRPIGHRFSRLRRFNLRVSFFFFFFLFQTVCRSQSLPHGNFARPISTTIYLYFYNTTIININNNTTSSSTPPINNNNNNNNSSNSQVLHCSTQSQCCNNNDNISLHAPPSSTAASSEPTSGFVVVTFDYDALDPVELTIREGQVIENVSTDESGWWKGTLNGHTGLFPHNFVVAIDASAAQEALAVQKSATNNNGNNIRSEQWWQCLGSRGGRSAAPRRAKTPPPVRASMCSPPSVA
jgi:hypothetical protein